MTRTEKYNFTVTVDQFHQSVNSSIWEDIYEKTLIDIFEQQIVELKALSQTSYTMLELGSNQCYYSLLFKHILGKDKTTNIMVEPYTKSLEVGKNQFALNRCEGVFYNAIIGNDKLTAHHNLSSVSTITIKQIIDENHINEIDVLHCDIDGFEVDFLKDNIECFEKSKFKIIFLLTHADNSKHGPTHAFCKDYFANLNYKLITEISDYSVGWDSLLVYTKK